VAQNTAPPRENLARVRLKAAGAMCAANGLAHLCQTVELVIYALIVQATFEQIDVAGGFCLNPRVLVAKQTVLIQFLPS
jgi:hypothetical protein